MMRKCSPSLLRIERYRKLDSVVQDAIKARSEGRNDDALRLLVELFDRIKTGAPGTDKLHFITMFEWSQLTEEYRPAYEALVCARDEQMRCLLDGDEIFGNRAAPWPQSRFCLIVDMNQTLKDTRATYELFKQFASLRPAFAQREAYLALPAMVEVGDFVLAQQYLSAPLERLDELNQQASRLPLFPPARVAPRLAAELTNFMRDVILGASVLEGLGRNTEAKSLRSAALSGITSDEMRALAESEIANPGTIMRELTAHQMLVDGANETE